MNCTARVAHMTGRNKGMLCGVAISLPETDQAEKDALRGYVKKREEDIARWDSAYEQGPS